MTVVPSANAMLIAAPDLDESDFFTAFCTALEGKQYVPKVGSDTEEACAVSPMMLYCGRTDWMPCPPAGIWLGGQGSRAPRPSGHQV